MLIICSHGKSNSLIPVSVQTVCTLNHTSINSENRKKSLEIFDAGIGNFQDRWANSMVADAL